MTSTSCVRAAAQRDEYLALAQRTQADFENYRKRVAREAAAAQERGDGGAREGAAAGARQPRPGARGRRRRGPAAGGRAARSRRAERRARARRASSPSRRLGEVFDPSLHEAMATAPQPEGGAPSGTVVEVYQPGYRLGGNIIRPARVVVAA